MESSEDASSDDVTSYCVLSSLMPIMPPPPEHLASKTVLWMQGSHKPFSYVVISFSPKHYLMCSRFCLVWTLLLCIWKTDGYAWLYVCVSLNLVTCVFYLIVTLLGPREI